MAIKKPPAISHTQTILQHDGCYYAIVSAAIGFYLKLPEKFMHEQDLNELWSTLDLNAIPINEGFIKPKAEVMVVGKIPAPEKHSRYTMRLQMQGIDKSMVVFAPRKWVPGPLGTFVMDWDDQQSQDRKKPGLRLSWQNAWGGADYAANIEGTGFAKGLINGRSKLYEGLRVPPFEVPAPGIESPADDNIPPAGFSPMNMTDPRRWQYFGASTTYWQETGLPTLPKDFDFRFFQRVPEDQQREEKFMPGEAYQLEMGDRVIAGTLPQFKIRLLLADSKFARMLDQLDGGKLAELAAETPDHPLLAWFNAHSIEQPMMTDTVILIPEAMKGIVVSRACFPVQSVHMREWEHTLLSLEPPDSHKTLQDLQQELINQLQDAALHQGETENQLSKEQKQKARADKVFAKMQQAFKKMKPSEIASQTLRIKANVRQLSAAKDPNFMDYDFHRGELTEAKLMGLQLQNCTFQDVDFSHSVFQECSFLDCRFVHCNFYQAKLTACQLVNCRFQGGSWREIAVHDSQLQAVGLFKTELNQASIGNSQLVHTHLQAVDAKESVWAQTQVVSGTWRHTDFTAARFLDLRVQKLQIRDSNLQHVHAKQCMFNDVGMAFIRVDLSHSVWEGPNFMQSYWYKVKMHQAKMPNSVWGFSKIIYSYFDEVTLNDALFADSTFLRSHIQHSKLTNSIFAGAHIKDSDILTGNDLRHVNLRHIQSSKTASKKLQ